MFLIPLMIIPFILYNLAMFGVMGEGGTASLKAEVLNLGMMSGATWTMTLGDLLIVIGLIVLLVEIFKATRGSSASIIDHLLSMVLFVVFLIEFLLVAGAATQVFFVLMMITFIDVVAGFIISIKSASRDVAIGL